MAWIPVTGAITHVYRTETDFLEPRQYIPGHPPFLDVANCPCPSSIYQSIYLSFVSFYLLNCVIIIAMMGTHTHMWVCGRICVCAIPPLPLPFHFPLASVRCLELPARLLVVVVDGVDCC